jgi:hypothetical protein
VRDEKACAHDEHRWRVVFFPSRKICRAGLEDKSGAPSPPAAREFDSPKNGGDFEAAFWT